MIGRLTGLIIEKQPPHIVLDVNGVGYEVDVPMSTFYVLPHLSEKTTLFTHLVVREDAQLLYGFASKDERNSFRTLIKVSGIGAKIALAILSGMTSDELASAVAAEDIQRLSTVPGIGKKTAERLLLELKGKLGPDLALPSNPVSDNQNDITQALMALGYNEREASAALKALPTDVGVSEGIKLALKSLNR
jgi:Holliday junction DNA helicase RuvA